METPGVFNDFDFVVIGVVLLSGALALMRGVVREIFSLIAWGGAIFAATQYFPLAQPWTERYIKKPELASQAAGVVVFVIAFIVLSIIGALVCQLIKGKTLTAIDRSLGFIFGLVRGVLVVCMVYLLCSTIFWPELLADHEPIAVPLAEPATPPVVAPAEEGKATTDKASPPAPDWILKAKTRPFLAYGARDLKGLIPEKAFEKTTQNYLVKSEETKKLIDKKANDLISIPGMNMGTPPVTH